MNWPTLRKTFIRNAGCFAVAISMVTGAFAEDLGAAKLLMQEGKLSEALIKTNKILEKNPTDPSVQFVKGLILSELKKNVEAIDVFSKLTTDFPNYPEPYNNLAVLFATEGHYAKARVALETALKINPKYATAQENLGDVHLQAALQSYIEASRNDGDSAGIKAKVRSVRSTLGLPLTDTATAGKTVAAVGDKNASPAASPTTSAPPKSKEQQAERDVVLQVVGQWVKAWSAKDIDTYFSSYASDFRPPRGESRAAWEKMRRQRINNKDQIDVQVISPSVTVEDKLAIVNFQQVYVAGKISSNARKSLTLKNESGVWKIVEEKSDG